MNCSKLLKKISLFLVAIALFTTTNSVVFASESKEEANLVNTQEVFSTRAISGTGSVTTSGYSTFTIYSPGWSLWGHAEVSVTGGEAAISIVSPEGKNCISSGVIVLSPGYNQRVNLVNINKSGTYEVRVQSMRGNNVTVTVTLKDF